MIIIEQNTTNTVPVFLLEYFDAKDVQNAMAIEITFGTKPDQVRKLWYAADKNKSNAIFVKNTSAVECILSAADTNKWRYQVPMQIRIKDRKNIIKSSDIFYAYIQTTLSAEEF